MYVSAGSDSVEAAICLVVVWEDIVIVAVMIFLCDALALHVSASLAKVQGRSLIKGGVSKWLWVNTPTVCHFMQVYVYFVN